MNTTVPATLFTTGLPYKSFLLIASSLYLASFLFLLIIAAYLMFGFPLCSEVLIETSSLAIRTLQDRSLFGDIGNTWLIILLIAATIILGEANQQWKSPVLRNGLFLLYVFASLLSVFFYFFGASEAFFPNQNFSTITFTGGDGIGETKMPILTIQLILKQFCRGFAMLSFSIAFAKVIIVHAAVLLKNNIFMTLALAFSLIFLCDSAHALSITIKHTNDIFDNQATLTVTRANQTNPKTFKVNHDNNPHFKVNISETELYAPLLARFETKLDHNRAVEFYIFPFRARIDGPCPVFRISKHVNLNMCSVLIDEYLQVQRSASEVSAIQVQKAKAELFKKRFTDMYSIVNDLLTSQKDDHLTNLFYLIYLDLAYTYNILDVHSEYPHEQPHNVIIPANYERVYDLVTARLDLLDEDRDKRVGFLNHMTMNLGIGEKTMRYIVKQARSLCGDNIFNSTIYMHNYWRAVAHYGPEDYTDMNIHRERIFDICAYNANKTMVTLPEGKTFPLSPEEYFKKMFSTIPDKPKFSENSAQKGKDFVQKNHWKLKE